MTEIERIVVLETELKQIKDSQDDIRDKLDDLLSLKQKGMGAFWLASSLAGIVFMMFGNFIIDLFRGT